MYLTLTVVSLPLLGNFHEGNYREDVSIAQLAYKLVSLQCANLQQHHERKLAATSRALNIQNPDGCMPHSA